MKFNITYKLLIDLILIWTIFLMNIIFIGTLLVRSKVKKNDINRSFFFLSLMHLPNGLVILPLKFVQQIMKLNRGEITVEHCHNLMTMTWFGIQSTTVAVTVFCLYHLYLSNPSVKNLYSNKFYRFFSFGILIIWMIGSALVTFNFTYYYSEIRFNTCVISKSVTASGMLLLIVFVAPYTLCLVCYIKIFPATSWLSDLTSFSRISSLQKESQSTINTDHDSQEKCRWNRMFDFSKRSSKLSNEDKLSKKKSNGTNLEFSSSDSTNTNSNNDFSQAMTDPILEKKITKLLHIDIEKTNKNTYSKSSVVVGFVFISYFAFWAPFIAIILVEMMSRRIMVKYISWTIRLGYCNSFALPIMFAFYLRFHKPETKNTKG
uniref:GCR108 n=1 Tax=Schmidtea mediterranea TaxID=79327 RepID=A0A193KUM7_SCHMD|nr:GCR108 [Schmidtea mediterranea]